MSGAIEPSSVVVQKSTVVGSARTIGVEHARCSGLFLSSHILGALRLLRARSGVALAFSPLPLGVLGVLGLLGAGVANTSSSPSFFFFFLFLFFFSFFSFAGLSPFGCASGFAGLAGTLGFWVVVEVKTSGFACRVRSNSYRLIFCW